MGRNTRKPTVNKKSLLSLLRKKNESFASLLNDDLLELMTSESEILDFQPGEPIVKQQEPSDALFILLNGLCSVVVNDKTINQLEAGNMIGEMGLLQNAPRSATVIPIEKSRVLKIPKESFLKMTRNPRLTSWLISMLTERLQQSSRNTALVLQEMETILEDHIELGRVQRSLLPKSLPRDPRFQIQVLYEPCAYVGGDYYDTILLDENHLLMIVADVTGHGAQASITMAIVRSFIHQGHIGKSPGNLLKRLNRHLFKYGPDQHFVTAQVAIVDLQKNVLQYSYAGHPPLLHLRNSKCNPLKGMRSFFLRFKLDMEFQTSSVSLKSGDRIAFYTDGTIEMSNQDGDMFNVEGLQNLMENSHRKPLSQIPLFLEKTLTHFREGCPLEDDMTFMVLEYTKP